MNAHIISMKLHVCKFLMLMFLVSERNRIVEYGLVLLRYWFDLWGSNAKNIRQGNINSERKYTVGKDRYGMCFFLSECVWVVFHPSWEVWLMHRQVSVIWGTRLHTSNYIIQTVIYNARGQGFSECNLLQCILWDTPDKQIQEEPCSGQHPS